MPRKQHELCCRVGSHCEIDSVVRNRTGSRNQRRCWGIVDRARDAATLEGAPEGFEPARVRVVLRSSSDRDLGGPMHLLVENAGGFAADPPGRHHSFLLELFLDDLLDSPILLLDAVFFLFCLFHVYFAWDTQVQAGDCSFIRE